MSPERLIDMAHTYSFPRVSGDEPQVALRLETVYAFSPRERG